MKWAKEDYEYLKADRELFPPRDKDAVRGKLRWDGSDAQRLLKIDVTDGKHLEQPPREFRKTRPEYMLFDLDVFRDHIYQEVKSRKKWPKSKRKSRAYKRDHWGDDKLRRPSKKSSD